MMDEREIIRRRARATGTYVVLVFAPDADPAQPWETICETHGGVCSHETRKLAESFLSHPDEWCEDCMYGPGALDGTRSLDDHTTGGDAVQDIIAPIDFSPGTVTHHGFTVIASSTRNADEWVVLLLRTAEHAPDYYVTAKYPRPIDTTTRGWYSGHYFDNLRDAVDDFYDRA